MENSESTGSVINDCPACSIAIDVSALPPFAEIQCPHCHATVRMRRTMGQYFITGLLGEGGMSQVFQATDVHLQREVALKILHQNLSLDQSLTSMFEREAKLTASILHPNVVKVYTVGRDQGYFFIAMEVIDARSVEQLIADKGCLAERDVLRIAHDVTSGLKAAFEEGLIHRDIKPGNMLVMEDGTTKLVDFGLAVQQDGEDESEELWATPFYVPPEKLDGEPDTHLGDIYSLGATLYHAVAGKPPFEANTSSMDELKEIKKQTLHLKGEAPSLSKATLKLIESMMSYRPEDRIPSYDELLVAIEEIESKQYGATSRERSAAKSSQSSKLLWSGGAALALIVATLFFVIGSREPDSEDGPGISVDERVISKGDNSNTDKFLEGRDWIIAGNFRKAEPIFDELSGETAMASATRMWSLYFQGLSRLFLGRELEARESFGYIAAVPDAEGAEMDQIRDFMSRAARAFSEPLPIIDAEEDFAGSNLAALGLLTAGVKNWQQGEFESAIRLFEAYENVEVPADFAWVSELRSPVADFFEDWKILQTLPNPSRKSLAELGANRRAL
ncbi:MAG: serine/threonine-protein kinase, partial [Verrucomicrobiota bacterium]